MAADVQRLDQMSGGFFGKRRDAQTNRGPPENSSNCVKRRKIHCTGQGKEAR